MKKTPNQKPHDKELLLIRWSKVTTYEINNHRKSIRLKIEHPKNKPVNRLRSHNTLQKNIHQKKRQIQYNESKLRPKAIE